MGVSPNKHVANGKRCALATGLFLDIIQCADFRTMEL